MPERELTRRPFLRGLVAVVLFPISAVIGRARSGTSELRECLNSLVGDWNVLAVPAKSARRKLGWKSGQDRANALAIEVDARVVGDSCEVLRGLSVLDYREGRVVEFEGWLLSETALTVLLMAPGTLPDDAD